MYRKLGKIHWAKLSPMKFLQERFHGALCLKHLNNAIIRSLCVYINKYSWKIFKVLLETIKTVKFSPANLSMFTVV